MLMSFSVGKRDWDLIEDVQTDAQVSANCDAQVITL
jgi:hypothetical protein